MRISILGPMEVEGDGGPIALGGLRLRALLALLALEAGHTVTSARLIDALWPDEPPVNAANALQTLVRRLRAALRPYEWSRAVPAATRSPSSPTTSTRCASRRLARRRARADERGWRGAADLDRRPVPRERRGGLEEERLAAVEARAEARLAAGLPADLAAEAAAHPLRERLGALLMRALAAAGRQAEALALYERTRGTLADELGVDPGPELRAAHLAVLRGDSPPPPARRRRGGPGDPRAPDQLRRPRRRAGRLVGRCSARRRLVTLVGPGGAGKTRLATEAGPALDADARRRVAGRAGPRHRPGRRAAGRCCDALGPARRSRLLAGPATPTAGDPTRPARSTALRRPAGCCSCWTTAST